MISTKRYRERKKARLEGEALMIANNITDPDNPLYSKIKREVYRYLNRPWEYRDTYEYTKK